MCTFYNEQIRYFIKSLVCDHLQIATSAPVRHVRTVVRVRTASMLTIACVLLDTLVCTVKQVSTNLLSISMAQQACTPTADCVVCDDFWYGGFFHII
jgi:hypothetical protein